MALELPEEGCTTTVLERREEGYPVIVLERREDPDFTRATKEECIAIVLERGEDDSLLVILESWLKEDSILLGWWLEKNYIATVLGLLPALYILPAT